ncbi:hypothetical protein [Aestuariimicrobium ganziense]|uniref:hypothetical protein n=1 Tax=Aestuariimicrobium ganziense TaxID=2773677 RepID=UPI0019408F2C|nr:hypothetical protein [Aestuariimicrobium ganziense]
MARELASGDCKGTCSWGAVDDEIDGRPVFACASCGSEWTTDQTWTPRNADGELAPDVAEARAAHPVSSSPW